MVVAAIQAPARVTAPLSACCPSPAGLRGRNTVQYDTIQYSTVYMQDHAVALHVHLSAARHGSLGLRVKERKKRRSLQVCAGRLTRRRYSCTARYRVALQKRTGLGICG